MKDFIETVPQPRRRVVEGRRHIGNNVFLTVTGTSPDSAGVMAEVGVVCWGRSVSFWSYPSTLRNLAAACTELADVLDEQQEAGA